MAIQSNYDGKCYESYGGCGATWKKGDMIDTNGLKNSKGKDAWCVHGKDCPSVGGHPTLDNSMSTARSSSTNEEKLDFAESALKRFIATVKESDCDPQGVRDQFGAVFNTAMMQKK